MLSFKNTKSITPTLQTNAHLQLMADFEYNVNFDCSQMLSELDILVQLIQTLVKAGKKWLKFNKKLPKKEKNLNQRTDYFTEFWIYKKILGEVYADMCFWRTYSMTSYFIQDLLTLSWLAEGEQQYWFVSKKQRDLDSKMNGLIINLKTGITDCKDGTQSSEKLGFSVGVINRPDIMYNEWRKFLCHIVQVSMALVAVDQTQYWALNKYVYYWEKWQTIWQRTADLLEKKQLYQNRMKLFV